MPYLNRHAKETVTLFLERLGTLEPAKEASLFIVIARDHNATTSSSSTRHPLPLPSPPQARDASAKAFRMLHSLVRYPDALEVRDELARQWAPLLRRTLEAAAGHPDRGVGAQLRFQGIMLIHAAAKLKPEWLPSHPEVRGHTTTLHTPPYPATPQLSVTSSLHHFVTPFTLYSYPIHTHMCTGARRAYRRLVVDGAEGEALCRGAGLDAARAGARADTPQIDYLYMLV